MLDLLYVVVDMARKPPYVVIILYVIDRTRPWPYLPNPWNALCEALKGAEIEIRRVRGKSIRYFVPIYAQ